MHKEEKSTKEIKLGIYKHYKNKLYKVLFTATNSETKEKMVVYQDLNDEEKIWTRPEEMFLEEVEVDGGKVKRFQFVEEDKNDWQNKYLRALADYQNLLRQTAKEKAEFGQFARERFLMEILPVYDNLKMSLGHFNKDADQNNWIKGVEYVVKQFKDILANMGAEEIKTVGVEFDHALMDAVESEITDDKKQDGLVARELSAGYKLNGKVIKAARVVVYKIN